MERRTDRGDHCGEGVSYANFNIIDLLRKRNEVTLYSAYETGGYPCAFWCKSSVERL